MHRRLCPCLFAGLAALGAFATPASAASPAKKNLSLHELPELRVRGNSLQRQQTDTPAERLLALPRLNLRAQGTLYSQNDLRIRGSLFSGAGVTVAGLPLRNPQTEHFHAELPLAPAFFQPFDLVTGLDQVRAGGGHLVGSAAAAFARPGKGGSLRLTLGEGGGAGGRVLSEHRLGDDWGLQLHAAALWHPGQDYEQNDVARRGAAGHLQRQGTLGTLDLALGFRRSEFGARGFYGVSPDRFPQAYEELEDLLLTGVWTEANRKKDGGIRAGVSLRRLNDRYLLDESNPDFYRNEHSSAAAVFMVERLPPPRQNLGTLLRLTVEDEGIDSEGVFLGSPTGGLGNHRRQRAGLTVLPQLLHGPWTAHAGGTWVILSEAEPTVLGIAALQCSIRDNQQLRLSVTQTLRQPSYTELNYESPSSLGNSGLENQRATETELSWNAAWAQNWSARAAVFHRVSHHTVDWILSTPAARWQAADVGRVTTDGLETGAEWTGGAARAGLSYTLLSKDADVPHYASRYALDYAEQRVSLSGSIQLTPFAELHSTQEWLHYADNPVRRGGNSGLLGRLTLRCRPANSAISLAITVHNLWDSDLQAQPGQKAAGRWVQGRVSMSW